MGGIKIRLSDIKLNKTVVVTEIRHTGHLKSRLIDMGITPGVKITLIKTAPLGDPLKLYLRGYELTIRKKDAMNIMVEYSD